MLDPQDEQFDRRLATHLVSFYHQSQQAREDAFMDMADLRDYIAFARSYIHPQLSEEAGQALIQAYVGEMTVENPPLVYVDAARSEASPLIRICS